MTGANPDWRRAMSRQAIFALLLLDALLLALLELFFLPLRLDGTLLPDLGAFPVPVTALVAAVTTPLLVVQTAKLVSPRASFAPLVLWVLVMVVVGLMGPGGDVVLIQDWRALVLLAFGALPGAMVLGGALGSAPSRKPAQGGTRG
jgi:hypothetical protein